MPVLHRFRAIGNGLRRFVAVLAFVLTPLAGAGAAEEVDWFTIGAWDGSIYFGDDGKFDHCVAEATFPDGLSMLVAVNADGAWVIGYVDPDGDWTPGDTLEAVIQIDGGDRLHGEADAVDRDYVLTRMPWSLLDPFRRGLRMTITLDGEDYTFKLTSTNRLMAKLLECAEQTAAAEQDLAAEKAAADQTSANGNGGVLIGSGFAVAEGAFLTAEHIVERCTDVDIVYGGQSTAGRVVARDVYNNLALIDANVDAAPAVLGSGARMGDAVSGYGFAYSGILSTGGTFTQGSITAMAGIGDDTRYYQVSAPIRPGSSGGPLLDETGAVVGLLIARISALPGAADVEDIPDDVHFALKIVAARSFLDAYDVDYGVAAEDAETLTPADVADRARAAAVQVECLQ